MLSLKKYKNEFERLAELEDEIRAKKYKLKLLDLEIGRKRLEFEKTEYKLITDLEYKQEYLAKAEDTLERFANSLFKE